MKTYNLDYGNLDFYVSIPLTSDKNSFNLQLICSNGANSPYLYDENGEKILLSQYDMNEQDYADRNIIYLSNLILDFGRKGANQKCKMVQIGYQSR
jgi:hypothetical protein